MSKFSYSLFGESHGPAVGIVIENFPPGLTVDMDFIQGQLYRRRPQKDGLSTARREEDGIQIVSGVFQGKTTGAPICILIGNQDTHSKDYEDIKHIPRPSHSDYTAYLKYNGFADYRGGGHFSGRLTTPLVCAGALCKLWLKERQVYIGAHILQLQQYKDRPFSFTDISQQDLEQLETRPFPVLDALVEQQMKQTILEAAKEGTSVGGIIQCAVTGFPAGMGEPDIDCLEGIFARHIFAVSAVKGIEFGLGFGFAQEYGHKINDEFYVENGKVKTFTNYNGGINGGISNGMPIVFNAVIKPTPSISRPQKSIDLNTMENTTLKIHGRHDPCILSRAAVVIESAAALAAMEVLM